MGSGFKKNQIDMGNYIPSEKEQSAFEWGIRNNISISPAPKNTKEWYLDIIINGSVNRSPLAYGKIDIWKQLYKFYLYYYNKHNQINEVVKDIKKVEQEEQIIKEPKQQSLF